MKNLKFTFRTILKDSKQFKLRTLFEKEVFDVLYKNKNATSILLEASKKTSLDNSWLVLPDESAWMIHNAFLNTISEFFAIGHLSDDFGIPCKSEWYVFGYNYSKQPDVKFRKIRLFLMKESMLMDINENLEPEFENSKHKLAYQAVVLASRMVKSNLDKNNKQDIEGFKGFENSFHRVCISLPCYGQKYE